MMNYEATKSLVHERQHQLAREAVLARLARRVRRARHNGAQAVAPVEYKIILPAPKRTHAAAA